MKKPIIGIVGRVGKDTDSDNIIYVGEEYRKAIIKHGGIPILILPPQNVDYNLYEPNEIKNLNNNDKKHLEYVVSLCNGILLPGGYKWYEYDEYIFKYAYKKNIPILGVCAGMQMMASIDNNKYERCVDDTKKIESKINHYEKNIDYVHNIKIFNKTLLKQIVNKNIIQVNSRHTSQIKKVTDFEISAVSIDGVIEAIEDKSKNFVLGVQWHPESILEYDKASNMIYETFIKKAKQNSK